MAATYSLQRKLLSCADSTGRSLHLLFQASKPARNRRPHPRRLRIEVPGETTYPDVLSRDGRPLVRFAVSRTVEDRPESSFAAPAPWSLVQALEIGSDRPCTDVQAAPIASRE